MTLTLTKKNCFNIAALSFLMVFMLAGTGFAYGPRHYDGHGPKGHGFYQGDFGPKFDKYLVEKGVSAETVNQYRADMDKFRDGNKAARDAMRAKGLEFYEEMIKPAPDAKKAKALQAELSKMRTDMEAKKLDQTLLMKQKYPQICEIMQQKFHDKGFGPGHKNFETPKPGPRP